MDLELMDCLSWLASGLQPVSILPALVLQAQPAMSSFDVRARDLNLGPPVCTASTLPNGPHPQPLGCTFSIVLLAVGKERAAASLVVTALMRPCSECAAC